MKTIILSGKIGSGKSSLMKSFFQKHSRGAFFKNPRKFSAPLVFISVDALGAESRNSEKSQKIFTKHPLLRNIKTKSQLKKKLFSSNPQIKTLYWNFLEKILHPQIRAEIQKIQKKFQKKKGTLIFECPIPEKLFSYPKFSGKNFGTYSLLHIPSCSLSQTFLSLKKVRNISVREFFGFLQRQK